MTVLSPMTEDDFRAFLEEAIAGYAASNVKSGRWSAETAMAQSKVEFDRLLPKGLATPDNYLYRILGHESEPVGILWWAAVDNGGVRGAFIYEIRVQEAFRRQGHAKRAIQALEPIVREHGIHRLGLHVFAYNEGAQALYRSLGFEVTSLNMLKSLTG